jgi:hypothetical protein
MMGSDICVCGHARSAHWWYPFGYEGENMGTCTAKGCDCAVFRSALMRGNPIKNLMEQMKDRMPDVVK